MLSDIAMFNEYCNVIHHTGQVEKYRNRRVDIKALTNLDTHFKSLYRKFEYSNELSDQDYCDILQQRMDSHYYYANQTPAKRDEINARRREIRAERKRKAEQEKNPPQP